MRDKGKGAVGHAVQFSSHFQMEVPHHRWHFQMEVPVDLFCQTRLSERPVSGICFTPLRGTDVTRGRPGNFTVPVGQSPLAAVIKIPLLLAFPSHASRSHRTLGFEYRPPELWKWKLPWLSFPWEKGGRDGDR